MIYRLVTALIPLLLAFNANGDHKADADWSWHILSSGISESRMSLYRRDRLIGIYNFSCDLTDASEGDRVEKNASLNLVRLDTHPDGLLLITCQAGAHAQQVAIIDLASKSNQPVFAKTGSFIADWELQDGELWIRYDRPCDTGPTVECPDGFETIFTRFPE